MVIPALLLQVLVMIQDINRTTNNDSMYDEDLGVITPVFISVYITVWLTACILNSASLCVLCKEARDKLTWANILLCCIAVMDLLILFLVLVPSIVALFVEGVLFDSTSLCYFQGCTLNVSVLFLWSVAVFVSVDQYLAICHPFMYSIRVLGHRSRANKILFAILLSYLLVCVCVSIIPVISGAQIRPMTPPLICYYDLHSQHVTNTVSSIINMFLLVMNGVIMAYCALTVGYKFYQLHTSSARQLPTTAMDRQQIALAKLVIIIAIVFLSCSIPFEVNVT